MKKQESRAQRWRPRSPKLEDVERSLDRYPGLDEQELAALVRDFRRLSLIDKAVLTAHERLSGKLPLIYHDHRAHLGVSVLEVVILICLPASIAIAGVWLAFG